MYAYNHAIAYTKLIMFISTSYYGENMIKKI